jgi:hypothetical protein
MIRLARRAADRRIGTMRTVGIAVGLGFFVAAGAMHYTTNAVVPAKHQGETNAAIRWLCTALVVAVIVPGLAPSPASFGVDELGDRAVALPLGWSIAQNALMVLVAVGGLVVAAFLTVCWSKAQRPSPTYPIPISGL